MPIAFLKSDAFPFGEGLFETLPWKDGKPVLFEDHWARMRASAAALAYPFPFEHDAVLHALQKEIQNDCRLRIVYRKSNEPTLEVQTLQPRDVPKNAILLPVKITPHPLAQHKVTSRELYEERRDAAVRAGATDALLLSPQGEVLETTRANIFAMIGGILKTPPLNGQMLPGIMRNQIIQSSKAKNCPVREESITEKQLAAAEEIFITNSIIGVVPVIEILGLWKRNGNHAGGR